MISEEHKRKISEAQKGKKKPPRSEEHKRNLSIACMNRKHPEETKRKISETKSREGKPAWNKDKTEIECYGKERAIQIRKNFIDKMTGRKFAPCSEERKIKISKVNKGRKRSAEQIERIASKMRGGYYRKNIEKNK